MLFKLGLVGVFKSSRCTGCQAFYVIIMHDALKPERSRCAILGASHCVVSTFSDTCINAT